MCHYFIQLLDKYKVSWSCRGGGFLSIKCQIRLFHKVSICPNIGRIRTNMLMLTADIAQIICSCCFMVLQFLTKSTQWLVTKNITNGLNNPSTKLWKLLKFFSCLDERALSLMVHCLCRTEQGIFFFSKGIVSLIGFLWLSCKMKICF